MHVKFLVRCSVALLGGLGSPTGVSASSWFTPVEREHPAAVCLSSASKAKAAKVAVVARAAGRGGEPSRQGHGEDAHRRTLLPAAVLRPSETQQERPRGSQPSGLVQESAETAQRRDGDRADHH